MTVFNHLGKGVELLAQKILRVLFPDFCLGCGKFGILLCPECVQNLNFPITLVDSSIVAMTFYQDAVIKRAIHELKFRHRKEIFDYMGDLIPMGFAAALNKLHIKEDKNIVLVPIPLWHERERERGFNQSSVFADAATHKQLSNMSINTNLLVRTRKTPPQTSMGTKNDRAENIKGCFKCGDTSFAGKTVIVIDDIVTTGATMREAMHTLKKAGAKEVYGIAFAH